MTKNTQFSPAGTHGPSPARTLEPPPAPSDGESRPHTHGGPPCAGARDEEVLRGGGGRAPLSSHGHRTPSLLPQRADAPGSVLGTREMRCRVTGPARGPVLDNSVAINWAERGGFERKVAVSSGRCGSGRHFWPRPGGGWISADGGRSRGALGWK